MQSCSSRPQLTEAYKVSPTFESLTLVHDAPVEMLRMLEAQAPAKQTATETISTLSSRLNNATLLEDRRAAILGLRSFAKEYPASVASGSLRGLIGCLTKDLEDIDTIKVVLETLIMLFNPNPASVSWSIS
jgi:intracellular protein transport protein USO1